MEFDVAFEVALGATLVGALIGALVISMYNTVINSKDKQSGLIAINMTKPLENKERRFGSDDQYYLAIILDENNTFKNALFTIGQIKVAIDRAEHNPEDLT